MWGMNEMPKLIGLCNVHSFAAAGIQATENCNFLHILLF